MWTWWNRILSLSGCACTHIADCFLEITYPSSGHLIITSLFLVLIMESRTMQELQLITKSSNCFRFTPKISSGLRARNTYFFGTLSFINKVFFLKANMLCILMVTKFICQTSNVNLRYFYYNDPVLTLAVQDLVIKIKNSNIFLKL